MSPAAAPVAATRPVRPRRPLAAKPTTAVLRRVLPTKGENQLDVAAFGSSI